MKNKLALVTKKAHAEDAKLAARGRRAIAIVRTMKARIEKSFYEMGKALAVLDDPRMFHALGHASFDALCSVELGVSPASADRLIHIAQSFAASEVKKLSSTKATAIIDLARAIGGRTTPRGILARGTIHVGKTSIDVKSANATKIAAVAKQLRDGKHHDGPGIRVSSSDARFVKSLAAKMRAAKIHGKVEAIAAGAAEGAKMRIVIHVHEAKALAKALASNA